LKMRVGGDGYSVRKAGTGLEKASLDRTHYLFPGTLFASCVSHLVTTVLGSCVSVCLLDPSTGIGGINHFLLPFWNGEGLPTPRYGNIAIPKLVEKMEAQGGKRSKLVAKVFGGSSMWEGSRGLMAVGERNVYLALEMLEELHIPVVASDLGGAFGRKILFDTASGRVLLRRHRGMDTPGAQAAQGKGP
jgi:chemotaxis protein CheD